LELIYYIHLTPPFFIKILYKKTHPKMGYDLLF